MFDLELEKIVSGPSLAKGNDKKEEKKDDPNDKEFEAGYNKNGPYAVYRCRT